MQKMKLCRAKNYLAKFQFFHHFFVNVDLSVYHTCMCASVFLCVYVCLPICVFACMCCKGEEGGSHKTSAGSECRMYSKYLIQHNA